MSKFKKKTDKGTPAISTASLPDIVFMLLFFFMVATKMRDSTEMVKNSVPEATELVKLEHKELVSTIYVGTPIDKYVNTYGKAPRIQLGDKFADVDEIPFFLEKFRAKTREAQRPMIFTSLKVDSDVTMGLISDIKTKLRRSGQLKLNYSAKRRMEK